MKKETGVSTDQNKVSLDDKYTLSKGRIYLTGSQALVRIPLVQRRRDQAAGLNTAGFISGYRGSPMGVYDLALWNAEQHLEKYHIHFQPGTNEDTAATAIWGSQQVGQIGEAKYDGVFSIWYGKGPGVDRSGDAIKHGNYAGTSKYGGVLLLCGDDPAARSSTIAHQSEHAMIHFGVPMLHPATIQEYLDFGELGFALSRYSGCWVGFKCVTDTVESSASVQVDAERIRIELPHDHELPEAGLNIQKSYNPVGSEARLYQQRHAGVHAFVRANNIDRVVLDSAPGRLGIVTTGKTWLDVMEALELLGIDAERAGEMGLGVYKVGLVYPLEPTGLRGFANGYEQLFVIEEKRSVIEQQLAHLLYNLPENSRPKVVGKTDLDGGALVSEVGELSPDSLLEPIGKQLLSLVDDADLRKTLAEIPAPIVADGRFGGVGRLVRTPSFCAGCPHSTSTRVPEGSISVSGIGCHTMAIWMTDRQTLPPSQMGGEGASWIGQAPFVRHGHIFQNLGDGTYFHSGLLAIRANVAAGTNITYKILLNGAIAMTGGQVIEGQDFHGEITAPHVAQQVWAEGVKRIALVSDDPSRHDGGDFPATVSFHHRDDLDRVQKSLRECRGVSVLIYEQPCATERRRLRKRGAYDDPAKHLFINAEVCEGCGDCGVQSSCIALEPVETDLGRKRRINQSACNRDYSCLKGFCPGFVTVHGATLKKPAPADTGRDIGNHIDSLPEPTLPELGQVFNILVAGVGGSGVITIGALLGMAAHIEGKTTTVLDITGLAQRNGPVTSNIRLSSKQATYAARIPRGSADLVIGCDLVVAMGPEQLGKMSCRTSAVYNLYVATTSGFATNPDLDFHVEAMQQTIVDQCRPGMASGFDATGVAVKLLGNAIGANLFLVGFAWQKGLLPLRRESIARAIELNGTAVGMNRSAFDLGRLAAQQPEVIRKYLDPASGTVRPDEPDSLVGLISRREAMLTDYQNSAYARRYRKLVDEVMTREREVMGAEGALSETVARYYAKLLAYKDEYEVARLYSDPEFQKTLRETFDGDFELTFNLAPPLWAGRDKETGRYRKRDYGPWILTVFKILSRLKILRGTRFDVFGQSEHRQVERRLITEYREMIEKLLPKLSELNHPLAVELASLPEQIRGFDLVKAQCIDVVIKKRDSLLQEFCGVVTDAAVKSAGGSNQ